MAKKEYRIASLGGLAGALVFIAVGCGNGDSRDSERTDQRAQPVDAPGDCSAGGGGAPVECAIKTGASLCTSIPKFSGIQVVDGSGSDFCDVPANVFAVKDGVIPGGAPPKLPNVAKARVAWDGAGIHAHVHVDAPYIRSDDAVELDIGGGVAFAGGFNGVTSDASSDLGFVHIEMGVHTVSTFGDLSSDEPAVAWVTYVKSRTNYGEYTQPLVDPGKFAYRDVPGGYEVELFLPWVLLNRSVAPSSGTAISIAHGLRAANAQVNTYAWQAIAPTTGPGPCGANAAPTPDCDDRTWCNPTLE